MNTVRSLKPIAVFTERRPATVDDDFLQDALGDQRPDEIFAARVNIDRYDSPTPYSIKFVSPNGKLISGTVAATKLYETFLEFITDNWRKAAPNCASLEDAIACYSKITLHDDDRPAYTLDTPVIMLTVADCKYSGF